MAVEKYIICRCGNGWSNEVCRRLKEISLSAFRRKHISSEERERALCGKDFLMEFNSHNAFIDSCNILSEVMANKGPLIYGFPVLGILGFVFAGLLGLGLAVGILRSGRL